VWADQPVLRRVRSARIAQLDDWAERVLLASALDELLEAGASG